MAGPPDYNARMPQPLSLSSNVINLRRLNGLRLIVLAAEILVVWLAMTRWMLPLPIRPLAGLFIAVAAASLLTAIRLRLAREISDSELFAQFTVEVLAFTALLYLSGGASNPFAPFYLLPLVLTAMALPVGYAWAMIALTVLSYSLLTRFYVPLPEIHAGHGEPRGAGLHDLGMWTGFVFSALLIGGFAVRMGRSVRERDRRIAELHEQRLQQEHLLALGTLATGAAHELGTPLATLAVVLKDTEAAEPLGSSRLTLLREQVARCKGILGSLTASTGVLRAESGQAIGLEHWLQGLCARWQRDRAGVQAEISFDGPRPAPCLVVEQTLEHAIINVLNNAADASPQAVRVQVRWTAEDLMLEVCDRGSGLAPELQGRVGTPGLTTKPDGLGLGLFLSLHTLRRFEGEVQLADREGGGTCCRVRLPLASLRIDDGR
jgi:two-component system sensor histidine kinase RegB